MATTSRSKSATASPRSIIRAAYARSGWIQSPPDPKMRRKKKAKYRRGYEARLSVPPADLARVLRSLKALGFSPGSHYEKANCIRIPIYGKEQVARFVELVGK